MRSDDVFVEDRKGYLVFLKDGINGLREIAYYNKGPKELTLLDVLGPRMADRLVKACLEAAPNDAS